MRVEVSVDDGYPLDLDLAYRLIDIGITATFYAPAKNIEGLPTLSVMDLSKISRMGHEIGGHTYNHRYLDKLVDEEAHAEIAFGIEYIQDVTSTPVTKFCLPGGKFPKNMKIFDEFSFHLVRTTRNMNFEHIEWLFDPSYQYYPHNNLGLISNAVKQLRYNRIAPVSKFLRCRNVDRLPDARLVLNQFSKSNFVHVWCHSWELERLNLFDRFIKHLVELKDV